MHTLRQQRAHITSILISSFVLKGDSPKLQASRNLLTVVAVLYSCLSTDRGCTACMVELQR